MSESIKHTPKLWERKQDNGTSYFFFWCNGCGHAHSFEVPRWKFNGNVDSPSFTPSLRMFITDPETKKETTLCHLFVTNGQIVYCGDCSHKLSGQTVPMSDIPDIYGF